MDDTPDLDIGCQVTVKYKRTKKRKVRSKKLKKILDILRSGKEKHIIQYTNEEKTEFEVKYVDKKNKKVWSETDISLFLALDAVSSKPRDQKNLAEETKNRFKSNMSKFVRAGYLKYLGIRKISKTVVYKKYRILKDFPIGDESEEGCSPQSTGTQSRGSSEDRSNSIGSSSNSSCSFPSTFHYSCLSEKLLESDEYEMRADGNEESVNILHEVNEEIAAKDYIAGETSIGMQYVNRSNWNSAILSYGNEGSINIVPAVGEEIEVKGCIADEALNFPVGMKYGNEPNSEEYENIPNENEESVNILHEVNEEIAAKDYIAGESSNLSIGMQYVNKPYWISNEYEIIPDGNEKSSNNLPVMNEEGVVKDYIAHEISYLSIGTQYVNETNWNESNFDDATLFEEMENDKEILKDSTNPLLSSAVVSEQNTGLIPDSKYIYV